MKKLLTPLLFATALIALPAHADEKEIRQSLKSKLPKLEQIDHIKKTPYSGLYEIVIGDQLLYTDAKGEYLFQGNVIDLKKHLNVTEERSRELFAIDFDKLPLDLAIKRVKGNGTRKMAYFTDPNCGFCKKLEKELSKVTDVTLYLFMYPIFNGSDQLVRNVHCAKDPIKAWDDLMLNGNKPADANCKTGTDKVVALARKMNVNGTPNLIFGDGVQNPGYMPAEDLEQRLNASVKK